MCLNVHVCVHLYIIKYTYKYTHKYTYLFKFMCVSNSSAHTHKSPPMGWLRLVGSLKLQVSFAEYRLFYRAPLQKRPIILRSLLIVATPYPFSLALWACVYVRQGDTVDVYMCVSECTFMRIQLHVYVQIYVCLSLERARTQITYPLLRAVFVFFLPHAFLDVSYLNESCLVYE